MQAGTYITDGTTKWLVVDIRDGSMVGDITYSPILRPGHVKANGALLANASINYPRLVSFAADNNLTVADDTAWESNKAAYVYDDASDTLRVPDAGGRVLQGGDAVESREAGLPNINGEYKGSGHSSVRIADSPHTEGALYQTGQELNRTVALNILTDNVFAALSGMRIDASLSNPIYSASQTVQPPALVQIPQIRY